MASQLVITPSGFLALREHESVPALDPASAGALLEAFAESPAAGLFALANQSVDDALPAAWTFWQDFARRYVTELCHLPETTGSKLEPLAPPSEQQLAGVVAGAPPMPGGEYLRSEVLATIWNDLDGWVRERVAGWEGGLAGFLNDCAPLWHQVGRVCFHLAENKVDEQFPFAFLATYATGLSRGKQVRYQPLSKALQEYAGAKNKPALVRLLSPVQRASEQSPLVHELLEQGDLFHPLAWTPAEAHRFLREVPRYEASGILVRLPDWWSKRPRPRVEVTLGEKRQTALNTDAMLDFRVDLALGDETLSEDEWQTLLAGDEGLVLLKGRWVEVDRQKLTEALGHWKKVEQASEDGAVSFVEGMRLLAGVPADLGAANGTSQDVAEWSFVRAGDWLGQTLEELRNPARNGRAMPGEGLNGTLRPYQKRGADWLCLLTSLGLGACLADDMGLGKTIQVLSLLLDLKASPEKKPPSLLVLPASLLANWKAEIERFTPSLSAVFVHPSETDKAALERIAKSPKRSLKGVDVVLTTYGMLGRQDWLLDLDWQTVILDEAQAIKNPSSRQTRTVKKLRARARVALTGTPVENRLGDLWSLFDFLCPGLLGTSAKFKQMLKSLEDRSRDRYAPLRNLVQPYILRRMKTDKTIIADLPEKSEVKAYCGLTKRQAVLYEKSVAEMARLLEGLDGMKRRGLVLSYLMRFKQICNHPSQLLGDGEYAVDDSGKFGRLQEICEEIASRQEKVLVFTQFREMTEPLSEFLRGVFGQPGLVLHGGTRVGKRRELLDAFQRESGPPFFVLSLKAGGTGLNLTAASHVVHFDRWWNPAVENQATDRAFRIGQLRNVLVHKFVCRGTIEERIDALIEEKKSLAADVLEGGAEKLLTEMNDQELLSLVSLDVNKALA